MARELHDESGQVLTALAVHLRALEDGRGARRDPRPDRRDAPLAGRRRRSGLRELATRLRPTAIDEHGLADAIEEQAARLRRTGVAVDVELRGLDPPLPEEVQTVIFRVAQESHDQHRAPQPGARTPAWW